MKLGTNFRFSKVDEIHQNREAWDERIYSYNSWDDKNVLQGVSWDELLYKTAKGGFMTAILWLIGLIFIMLWAAW